MFVLFFQTFIPLAAAYFIVGLLLLHACARLWPHILDLSVNGPMEYLLSVWPVAVGLTLFLAASDAYFRWRITFSMWRARRRHRRSVPECRTVRR